MNEEFTKAASSPSKEMSLDKEIEELSLNAEILCPIASLKKIPDFTVESQCPFHKTVHNNGGESQNDQDDNQKKGSSLFFKNVHNNAISTTEALLSDIGGGDRIRQMTTRFYAHAFKDQTISKFMFETDCAAAHGQRLGDWIIEFMGGDGTPWTDSGRQGLRQYSHHRAWDSSRRDKQDRGLRFKLDDCRIWMRLMFWSAREVGLDKHSSFMHWFVPFIQRFIGIYERTAPTYTKKDSKWSLREKNINDYVNNGFLMKDVVGIGR